MKPISRRTALWTLAGSAGFALSRAAAQTSDPSDDFVRLKIDFSTTAPPVPLDFVGFSYEPPLIARGDYFVPTNNSLIGLLHQISPASIIRIGGNGSDLPGMRLTREQLDPFAEFLRRANWKVIFGLNFGSTTVDELVADAVAASAALDDRLVAFQLGNEPDLWRGKQRPTKYGHVEYNQEWSAASKAIRAKLPDAPFAGPDLSNDSGFLYAFGQARHRDLKFLTTHYYGESHSTNVGWALPNLLRSDNTNLQRYCDISLQQIKNISLGIRLTEVNSTNGGGSAGVSDVFASALWALATLSVLATKGLLGADFHGGGNTPYSPIEILPSKRSEPRPVFLGLKFFMEIAAGLSWAPVEIEPANPSFRAFAFEGASGKRRLLLLNLSSQRLIRVRLTETEKNLSYRQLTAPSLRSTAGLRLTERWLDASTISRRAAGSTIIELEPAAAVALEIG